MEVANRGTPTVVLGAGPAGCTFAALRALRGEDVVVFDDDKRPEMLVGESLVPGVVPIFRRLGIEAAVAAVSTRKPGVTFQSAGEEVIHFDFKTVGKLLPNYSYNVERPAFDKVLRRRAEELGVRFVSRRAVIEADGQDRVLLAEESRMASGITEGAEPFIIDATGRARVLARAMKIPSERGGRDDVAYFAHYRGFEDEGIEPGQVIITALEGGGWSWRIPLPGKMSCGVVISKDRAKEYGATPEQRLAHVLETDGHLGRAAKNAERVSDVAVYTNYQLIAERAAGANWALLGDAFGFVDPMLSPGLFMALESAQILDAELERHGGLAADAFASYQDEVMDWHKSWKELIAYFYDGSVFSLHVAGQEIREKLNGGFLPKMVERHMSYHIASMASGARTRSSYSRGLLRFMRKHGTWGVPLPDTFAVR